MQKQQYDVVVHNNNGLAVAFIVLIIVLSILSTGGDPDLLDAVKHYLFTANGCPPE